MVSESMGVQTCQANNADILVETYGDSKEDPIF